MTTRPVCAIIGMGPGNGAALAGRFSSAGQTLALLSRTTDFSEQLVDALAVHGTRMAFDPTGGGTMAGRMLSAMEAALLRRSSTPYNRYGSMTPKQVYIYGTLNRGPIELPPGLGFSWNVGGWLLWPFLLQLPPGGLDALKQRVADELHTTFASNYQREIGLAELLSPEVLPQAPGLGEWLVGVIPSNALAAAAASAMLPLVVFAMFFGFALTRIEADRRERMLDLVRTVGDTMIVIVRWVLWAAPLGVFALVLAVCAQVGFGLLGALGWYILLQCTLYISVTLLMYVVAVVAAGERLRRFASALMPVQAIAASTQSSLASLPVMIESARNRLGYPLAITSLVLPMAVSLFRIGSPVQYISVAAFIAWMYGVDLTASQLMVAVGLSVVISMGSVGLPGQVSFMTTNMPVTQAMGLPVEPLGILLAVDTIPDAFATVANTSADMAATGVVARRVPVQDGGPPEPAAVEAE